MLATVVAAYYMYKCNNPLPSSEDDGKQFVRGDAASPSQFDVGTMPEG